MALQRTATTSSRTAGCEQRWCRHGHFCFSGPGKGELLEQQQLGSSAIGPSRFWVKGHQVPEPNADAKALLEHYPYLPHRFDQPQPWTAKSCSDLQTQVLRVVKVGSYTNVLSCHFMPIKAIALMPSLSVRV